jgi:serine/threonine protein kinase
MSTTSSSVASLIHNDINMDNILLGYRNGIQTPLINDFNIAVFRKWNVHTKVPCWFHGRFANPQWMSPEQMEREGDELSIGKLDEKIDIYALGNILYKIAVGNSPWKYNYKVSKITSDEKPRIARAKLRGQKPKVPPDVILAASGSSNNNNSNSTASLSSSSSSSSIKAILSAMNKCYRNNATLRPSAEYIATYLQSELDTIELRMKVMDSFEF